MSADGKGSLGYRVAKKVLFALFLLSLSIVILGFGGRLAFIIELPIRFFLGWAIHAWKALPHLFGKWQEAVLPLGCLLMAAVITHRFVRRWVSEKFPDRTWCIRYTAAVLSLLLLGSAAAIAASGVVHQMFWLGRGELLVNRGKGTEKAHVTMCTRNVAQAAIAFHNMKGRYPASISELEDDFLRQNYDSRMWLGDGKVGEPFILMYPGGKDELRGDKVLVVSPAFAKGTHVVVGFGDGTAKVIPFGDLAEVIRPREESEGGR